MKHFCIRCKQWVPEEFVWRNERERYSVCVKGDYYDSCMKSRGFKVANEIKSIN